MRRGRRANAAPLAAGKLKKVALIACMRKLLAILNAMAKTRTTFDPDHTHA